MKLTRFVEHCVKKEIKEWFELEALIVGDGVPMLLKRIEKYLPALTPKRLLDIFAKAMLQIIEEAEAWPHVERAIETLRSIGYEISATRLQQMEKSFSKFDPELQQRLKFKLDTVRFRKGDDWKSYVLHMRDALGSATYERQPFKVVKQIFYLMEED